MYIKKIFSFDNWIPTGDLIVSGVFHSNHLDSASIIVDTANIIVKGTVNEIVVHINTVEYNGAKLISDYYDKNKSKKAIFADILNLTGSVVVLATDLAPNRIGLKMAANIICLFANDVNLNDNLGLSPKKTRNY